MPTVSDTSLGPSNTPPIVKQVLALFIGISLVAALIEPWFLYFTGYSVIKTCLALSWKGYSSLYLWQPITYFWVESSSVITFSFLLGITFKAYMIWMFGTGITERYGSRFFLTLFIGSGIATGLLLLPFLKFTAPLFPVTGMTAPLLSLFVFWAMMNGEGTIFLFMIIPIKIRTLFTITLAAVLLTGISSGDLIGFMAEVYGILWGYLLAAGWWGLRSPYPFTASMDNALEIVGDTLRLRTRQLFPKKKTKGKVVSFETGEAVDEDELFVDAMLAKISEHGESSLTWRERRRLKKISADKKSKK